MDGWKEDWDEIEEERRKRAEEQQKIKFTKAENHLFQSKV